MKIVSWNLWRLVGATLGDVVTLVECEQPDLLLMQEATAQIDRLPQLLGGYYARHPLPGRIHGLAAWSPTWLPKPRVLPLPNGALFDRICQILEFDDFAIANVHLSHGQILNRRQLRRIAQSLPRRAATAAAQECRRR